MKAPADAPIELQRHADAAHDRIKARAGEALAALTVYTGLLNNPAVPRRTRYIRLREIADKAAAHVAPDTPCKDGCSACCYQAVPIITTEARIISAYTKRALDSSKAIDPGADMMATVAKLQGKCEELLHEPKPCPFLKDSRCSIYEVRPITCRTHHVLHPDASRCSLEGVAYSQVKYDLSFIDAALAPLSMEEKINDIRDWFPS